MDKKSRNKDLLESLQERTEELHLKIKIEQKKAQKYLKQKNEVAAQQCKLRISGFGRHLNRLNLQKRNVEVMIREIAKAKDYAKGLKSLKQAVKVIKGESSEDEPGGSEVSTLGVVCKILKYVILVLLAVVCVLFLMKYFTVSFPTVKISITEDKELTIQRSLEIFEKYSLCDLNKTYQSSRYFLNDKDSQSYFEFNFEKSVFKRMIETESYNFYQWYVRFYSEMELCETTVFFSSDLKPLGFRNDISEDMLNESWVELANLEEGDALELCLSNEFFSLEMENMTKIDDQKDWFTLSSHNEKKQVGDRIDHTFVFENQRKDLMFEDHGKVEIKVVVCGDKICSVSKDIRVPESFSKRFESIRSFNDLLANVATVLFFIIVIVVLLIGVIYLVKIKWINQRTVVLSLICSLVCAFLENILLEINKIPEKKFFYDTSITFNVFLLEGLSEAAQMFTFNFVYFGVIFFVGEALIRKTFGSHIQIWKFVNSLNYSSVFEQIVLTYFMTLFFLAFDTGLYLVATEKLNWFMPSSILVSPNSLNHYVPFLSAIVISIQAGLKEELIFRGVILGGFWLGSSLFKNSKIIRFFIKMVGFISQMILFSAAHANYPVIPFYARLVELLVPSAVFGFLFLRYNLIIPFIVHYLYDLFWFGIGIWVSDAKYTWVYRIVLVLAALFPLLFLGGVTILKRKVHFKEVGKLLLNSSWKVVQQTKEIAKKTFIVRSDSKIGSSRLILYIVLSVVFASIYSIFSLKDLFLNSSKGQDTLSNMSYTEMESLCFEKFLERGYVPSEWEFMSRVRTGTGKSDMQHRFILQEHNEEYEGYIRSGYLLPVFYHCRFIRFGEIEEAHFFLWSGNLEQEIIVHPETWPGSNLTREEASELARSVVDKANVVFEPDSDGVINDESIKSGDFKQPYRTDWSFAYKVSNLSRIVVRIFGNDTSFEKYIKVPENFEREQISLLHLFGLFESVLSIVVFLFMLCMIVFAVRGYIKKDFNKDAFNLSLIIRFFCSIILIAVDFRNVKFGFSPHEPFFNQAIQHVMISLVSVVMKSLFVSMMFGSTQYLKKKLSSGNSKSIISFCSIVLGLCSFLFSLFFDYDVLKKIITSVNDVTHVLGKDFSFLELPESFDLSSYSSFSGPIHFVFGIFGDMFYQYSHVVFLVLWLKDKSAILGSLVESLVTSFGVFQLLQCSEKTIFVIAVVFVLRCLMCYCKYHLFEKFSLDYVKYFMIFQALFKAVQVFLIQRVVKQSLIVDVCVFVLLAGMCFLFFVLERNSIALKTEAVSENPDEKPQKEVKEKEE